MLVTDIIQKAVAGELRFDFIESRIVAQHAGLISSQKGTAYSNPGDDAFLYCFTPRGAFEAEWVAEDGYLARSGNDDASIVFSVSGVERSSAHWTGEVSRLRMSSGLAGPAVHGRVHEWARTDERSTRSAYIRIIAPGRCPFPATIRHVPGLHVRHAETFVDDVRLEFRGYDSYTEISAVGVVDSPEELMKQAVTALGDVLDQPLEWVFMERHHEQRRTVTVRQSSLSVVTGTETAAPAMSYNDFWRSYSGKLKALAS